MTAIKVGILGGSGLDDPDIIDEKQEKYVSTAFGNPSDVLISGKISGVNCILLARHGRKHTIGPGNVNYRANIWALKQEGCTHVLVTTACGSLQEDIVPGQIVFIDQFIDRTHNRIQTFYDGSDVAPSPFVCHMEMAHPFCSHLRKVLIETAEELGIDHHKKGTMLTIEGPRFSSRAESIMWHQWGAHTINMTTVPEVILAKEAGLSYAAIALPTDYDSWREHGETVTMESVLKVFKENASKAKNIIIHAIPKIAANDWTDVLQSYKSKVEQSVMSH